MSTVPPARSTRAGARACTLITADYNGEHRPEAVIFRICRRFRRPGLRVTCQPLVPRFEFGFLIAPVRIIQGRIVLGDDGGKVQGREVQGPDKTQHSCLRASLIAFRFEAAESRLPIPCPLPVAFPPSAKPDASDGPRFAESLRCGPECLC